MKLDMVGLKVQNMAQSLAFYETLGFGILSGGPNEAYAELNNNGVRISLNLFNMLSEVYQIPLEDVLKQNEAATPKVELAFLVDEPKQVDDKCQELKDKGYETYQEPWDVFWGKRYAIIKGPDNNLLSLFAYLGG